MRCETRRASVPNGRTVNCRSARRSRVPRRGTRHTSAANRRYRRCARSFAMPNHVANAAPCARRHSVQWQCATHRLGHATVKRTSPQRQLPCDEGIKIFPCCIGFDHTTRACTPTYIHTARDGIPQRCPPMALATRPRIPALRQDRQSSALPAKCDVLIASKTAADRSRFPVTQVGIEGSSAARGEAPRIRGRQRLSLRNRL